MVRTYEAANLLEKHEQTTFLYSLLLTTFVNTKQSATKCDKMAEQINYNAIDGKASNYQV